MWGGWGGSRKALRDPPAALPLLGAEPRRSSPGAAPERRGPGSGTARGRAAPLGLGGPGAGPGRAGPELPGPGRALGPAGWKRRLPRFHADYRPAMGHTQAASPAPSPPPAFVFS